MITVKLKVRNNYPTPIDDKYRERADDEHELER